MKKLKELTEEEIKGLSDDSVATIIKYRKAEEGVKLIEKPPHPDYFDIPKADKTVFTCGLFGDKLAFGDFDELSAVITALKGCKTLCTVKYDYNRASSEYKFATTQLDKEYQYNDVYDTKSNTVYSNKTYSDIVDLVSRNKTTKEEYAKECNSYNDAIEDSKWIQEEVWDEVNGVRNKYAKLERLIYLFNNDYMPLADNNEDVAMNFLNKAHNMEDSQKEYVLANYKSKI